MALDAGGPYYTASRSKHWPGLFNGSGRGDNRFSPLAGPAGPVPVLYGARKGTVALLETVFHDVHGMSSRVVTRSQLAGRNLVRFELPERLVLYDLRDDALSDIGLRRDQLVSCPPSHYPCTREWSEALRQRKGVGSAHPVGIIWRSRVAELVGDDSPLLADLLPGPAEEVFVLFGDRLTSTDAKYYSATQSLEDLASAKDLGLVAQLADQLGATLA